MPVGIQPTQAIALLRIALVTNSEVSRRDDISFPNGRLIRELAGNAVLAVRGRCDQPGGLDGVAPNWGHFASAPIFTTMGQWGARAPLAGAGRATPLA